MFRHWEGIGFSGFISLHLPHNCYSYWWGISVYIGNHCGGRAPAFPRAGNKPSWTSERKAEPRNPVSLRLLTYFQARNWVRCLGRGIAVITFHIFFLILASSFSLRWPRTNKSPGSIFSKQRSFCVNTSLKRRLLLVWVKNACWYFVPSFNLCKITISTISKQAKFFQKPTWRRHSAVSSFQAGWHQKPKRQCCQDDSRHKQIKISRPINWCTLLGIERCDAMAKRIGVEILLFKGFTKKGYCSGGYRQRW